MNLKDVIRTIEDFPQKGVLFRDISPILQNGEYLRQAVEQIAEKIQNVDFDLVVGPESRGFIFGVPIAYKLNKGFIPIRKAGKLPYETIKKSYDLEYGKATIEMHTDAIKPGQKVVVIDDLLATGGTSKALIELVEEAGGIIEAAVFLIELESLGGREVLKNYKIDSIMKY